MNKKEKSVKYEKALEKLFQLGRNCRECKGDEDVCNRRDACPNGKVDMGRNTAYKTCNQSGYLWDAKNSIWYYVNRCWWI